MPPGDRPQLEVCIETPDGLQACAGLVDRIELCAGLEVGGLTPSMGLMQAAKESGLETHVLIRPRSGGFEYTPAEIASCLTDIETVRALGLAGVVIGATRAGALDMEALSRMIAAAEGIYVTLHRAIDVVEDRLTTLDQAIALRITRVLTSGGAPTAPAGAPEIRRMQHHAQGRIEVMAGGGVTPETAADLLTQTGVRALHASCSSQSPTQASLSALGFGQAERRTDRAQVMRLRTAMGLDDRPSGP